MPVNRCPKGTVPTDVRPAVARWNTRQESSATNRRLVLAKLNQRTNETNQVRVLFLQRPVQPRNFVVLAVGVVVAFLRAAKFIAGDQHWNALTEHQCRHHVFDLSKPERVNDRLIGWAFNAKVFTVVVVVAVTVFFTVSQIVLLAITDQVVHREAVVRRDEVDTGTWWTASGLIEVSGSSKPSRQCASRSTVASPITTRVITIAPVPFCPAIVAE